MCSILQIFALLLLILASWICNCQAMDKPDCTRMVFHPRCRGISAKRSSSIPLFEESDKRYNSDDSLESPNWKSEVDSDLLENIIRDIVFTNVKNRKHGRFFYDEEK